ncbi:unnamed protein product (macronuclear) [Paramecium tetraurelia]|uniref:Uncharacterized protein n=1 Tax=Paramecium tetraurelia TaxID=5888 RepID=A0BHJ9_PARTE|nr:uncharacterized protein GSPATT00029051001 [Paramecium tetraurelia]CAK58016.1 unnamed protein product [Paramecium tetraurelia]|eukprot:XP_001425414.1 hypothetical protein (macronuclear) [Paramecium tetraurelia strain d4-2]
MQGYLVEGKETNNDYSYEWLKGNPDLVAIEKGIPIVHFNSEIQKRDLEMEFRLLRRLTETQYHNENLHDFNPDIQKLNRYNNIIPFKHSIVKLKQEAEDEENLKDTYINANFINLINGKEKMIIATQGPLTQTFSHFWRMVIQEDMTMIMMLCNLRENQRAQCEQYWPKNVGESMQCGNVQVNLLSQDDLGNNIIKRVVKVTQELEEKTVIQIQWCGWPDQGVPSPSDFEVMRELLNMINEKLLSDQKVVFHCSAGVGRTGTLIALANLMILLRAYKSHIGEDKSKLEENSELYRISIFGIVRRLREQRWGMVHTSEQYIYLYKFIDEAIRSMFNI